MQLPQPAPRRQEENLIPLINIVFLLLIFFMIAGTIARPELFGIQPPKSTSGSAPASDGLVLLMSADGRMALDGKEVTVDTLVNTLQEELGEHPERPLQLKADAALAAERLHEVLRLLRQAEIEKLKLFTLQGG